MTVAQAYRPSCHKQYDAPRTTLDTLDRLERRSVEQAQLIAELGRTRRERAQALPCLWPEYDAEIDRLLRLIGRIG